jgi:hypothetical protein
LRVNKAGSSRAAQNERQQAKEQRPGARYTPKDYNLGNRIDITCASESQEGRRIYPGRNVETAVRSFEKMMPITYI